MYRTLVFSFCLILLAGVAAAAEEAAAPAAPAPGEAKTLGGMSVLGNNEAPMSLFIVPWKSSELSGETNLTRTLHERDVPVDREVFMREVNFYNVSVGDRNKERGTQP